MVIKLALDVKDWTLVLKALREYMEKADSQYNSELYEKLDSLHLSISDKLFDNG